jgi:hypothetical protein
VPVFASGRSANVYVIYKGNIPATAVQLPLLFSCILCVLHFVPNGLKLRGHLGSELQRKAATILSIEKDEEPTQSVVKALKVRDGSPLDVPLMLFAWDKEAGMHVYKGEKPREEKEKRKERELVNVARDIFGRQTRITYIDLCEQLQQVFDIKERTAKSYIRFMRKINSPSRPASVATIIRSHWSNTSFITFNFISNFYRKYQDTSGLELFSVKASKAEQDAKAIEENHRNPTPEGDKRAEMLRVPKPDFHEFKQGYRFDPAKIDWENLKKVGITADTLKNTKDFDRVMRGYKSRNTYTVSGTVGGFYLKPTDVKLSFYQAKDGTVIPKLHGVQQDEKLLQRPFHEHGFTKQEQGNLQGTGNLGGIAEIKDPKSGEQIPVFVSRDRYTHELDNGVVCSTYLFGGNI